MSRPGPIHRCCGFATLFAFLAVALAAPALAPAASTTFLPIEAEQTFVVPAGVTTIHAAAIGGKGGDGENGAIGGFGAVVGADLAVTPGQTLFVEVGSNGTDGIDGGEGGFNGGGEGGLLLEAGGGGGGASDIRLASRAAGTSLGLRVLVAGGGGGAGAGHSFNQVGKGTGGTAGATPSAGGGDGGSGGGAPGTQTAGGKHGSSCEPAGTDGAAGLGGKGSNSGCNGNSHGGGGGGGGLFGGGGAGVGSLGSGGGAGSSGFGAGATNFTVSTDSTELPSITLSYTPAAPSAGSPSGTDVRTPPAVLAPPTTVCKVPNLSGRSLKGAKKALRNNNCALGAVKHRKHGPRAVVGQGAAAGKILPAGTEVNVSVGAGSGSRHHRGA